MNKPTLSLNIDYYINADGNLVFTEKYHLDRGYCCKSGCLHCPYSYKDKTDPNVPAEFLDVWDSEEINEGPDEFDDESEDD